MRIKFALVNKKPIKFSIIMQNSNSQRLKISDRVRNARGNLTQSEFASRLLYSREYISEVERGVRNPPPRFIKALEALEAQRNGVVPATREAPQSGYVRIPRLDVYASAGRGIQNDDFPEVLDSLDVAEWRIRALFGRIPKPAEIAVVQVRGDSMEPDYLDGDAVLVDTARARFDGDGIYLFTLNGQAMIKRLQMLPAGIRVMSSNPRYESYTIPPLDTETLKIIGRAGASLLLRGL